MEEEDGPPAAEAVGVLWSSASRAEGEKSSSNSEDAWEERELSGESAIVVGELLS